MIREIIITECECARCSHVWHPRHSKIGTMCPKCKSKLWNIPRSDVQDRSEAIDVAVIPVQAETTPKSESMSRKSNIQDVQSTELEYMQTSDYDYAE